MPTVNTTEDLTRLLRENPDFREAVRREILSDELLALPQRFSEYAENTDRRLEALTASHDALTAEVSKLSAEVREFIKATNRRLGSIEGKIDEMDSTQSVLKGFGLEYKLARTGMQRMIGQFDIRRTREVRVAEENRASADFNNAIYDAEEQGTLSAVEYNRILRTDLIVRGRTRDDSTIVYVVAEASYTAEDDDIEKVEFSASAIRKVFPDAHVYPVLYCTIISDWLANRAEESDVTVMIEDDFG